MFRRRRAARRAPTYDPTTLEPKWRGPVEEVLAARSRFDALVQRLPDGATKERLEGLCPRLDAGVAACWEIATTAQAAAGALDTLEPDRITSRMKDARRRLVNAPEGSPERDRLQAEIDSLSLQLQSVSRLWDGLDDAAERLRLLELRLDGAVARAAELLLAPHAIESVEGDLSSAVDELEALRQAVDALGPG
jgi:hypothetical protein